MLEKFGGDSLSEFTRNLTGYRDAIRLRATTLGG